MKTRTSTTHPLRIDAVGVPGTNGEIGMTLFPGRRDTFSAEGPWERDIEADIAVIESWGPTLVLTLNEEHEFGGVGVPDFASRMGRAGFTWHHLPIPDGGVPDSMFEQRWESVGHDVRSTLRSGKRVVVHCRAGLGRTGMIAARLLVEMGMTSEGAIGSVRAARKGTIETSAQERHVRAQSVVDDFPMIAATTAQRQGSPTMPAGLYDRIQGAMLGAAIGDALGAAFEFLSSATIERVIGGAVVREYRVGVAGSLLAGRAPGLPTDDTAMTLALVRSLVAPPPRSAASVHRGFVTHLARSGADGGLYWNGGPGNACSAMLSVASRGAGPFENIDPEAGGNGAAMRAHPCGFFYDRAFVFELAGTQARLSHPHPGAVAAAQTVALLVHDAVYTGSLPETLPVEITDPTMLAAWEGAHHHLERGDRLPAYLRDVDLAGWNTVAAAHAIAVLYADDLETGIGMAAASGVDTDTIATIVGALLGATHGRFALPKTLLDGLCLRETIEELAEALFVEVIRQAGDPTWWTP
jgi:ADP-ribosyl-[dinitrogen reductase] hydrolase